MVILAELEERVAVKMASLWQRDRHELDSIVEVINLLDIMPQVTHCKVNYKEAILLFGINQSKKLICVVVFCD